MVPNDFWTDLIERAISVATRIVEALTGEVIDHRRLQRVRVRSHYSLSRPAVTRPHNGFDCRRR